MPDENETAAAEAAAAPAPEVLAEVREYYTLLQSDYARRVSEAERFLGFAESSEALGVRLSKLEKFLGIAG